MSKYQSTLEPEIKNQQHVLNTMLEQGILPLYFHSNAEVSVNVLRALYDAGVRAIEYTNRGKEALNNFKVLLSVRDSSMKDLQLGIGTIKNAADAKVFIEAGADFIISPGMVPEVAKEAKKANLLWVPGCTTVSEIIIAENCGAKLVKLFPGNLLKPSFVSTIKDIFPEMFFMPTGGIDMEVESISDWFKAGVSAIGIGSKMIRNELLESKDFESIRLAAKEALSIVEWIKK